MTQKDTMYITYETPQWRIDHLRGELSRPLYSNLPHRRFIPLRSSTELKPRWLVRVSDMTIIDGSDVKEEYCVLSYAKSQSGDIVNDNNGGHQITSHAGKNVLVTRHVPFEGIVQQICKDFNVSYIWYDRMCMEHSDSEQILSAYSHAYYTIVLIPELRVDQSESSFPDIGQIEGSEWWKESSNMKQASMSKRLLFVGSNVHVWWYTIAFSNMWAIKYETLFLNIFNTMVNPIPVQKEVLQHFPAIYKKSKVLVSKINASKILWQVHGHKDPHERMFALANLYPDIMGNINRSHDQPLEDLIASLYKLLGRMDASILFFGRPDADESTSTVIQQESNNIFPSWAGFDGVHVPQLPMSNKSIRTLFNKYKMDGNRMYVTSVGVTVSISPSTSDDGEDVSTLDDIYDDDDEDRSNSVKVTLSNSNCLTFVSMANKKLWRLTNLYGLRATHWLPVRKEA
ncbi:hypothetical protein BJV82DRAFT_632169, partial [Fennellomyces sp. T-0311]